MRRVYPDTSLIASLIAADANTQRAETLFASLEARLLLSDLARAEFASAVARKVRIGEMTRDLAAAAFSRFDLWSADCEPVDMLSMDVRTAESWIRQLHVTLRVPDAVHLAIARRHGVELATLDKGMAAAAQGLGVPLVAAPA